MKDIIRLIDQARNVTILPHINADGDAIGSSMAMRRALRNMGKTAEIYTEEPVEKRLEFLDDGIKVYDGEAVSCDLCIVLDCGDQARMGKRIAIKAAAEKVVNIDHHKTNTNFGDAAYVDADAAATGEILARLFKEMSVKLDRDIARYLYTAICSDTGSFAYSNVSPQTFKTAAELISYDIDHAEITRLLFDCVDLNVELMRAELTERIKSYYDGRLRIVTADEETVKKYGLKYEDTNNLIDLPRRIRGTEVAVTLKVYNGTIRASLRSNGDTDVASVALKFGGGGHTKAAGCDVAAESLEDAERLIVEAFKEVL